jgi:hypothetical protein
VWQDKATFTTRHHAYIKVANLQAFEITIFITTTSQLQLEQLHHHTSQSRLSDQIHRRTNHIHDLKVSTNQTSTAPQHNKQQPHLKMGCNIFSRKSIAGIPTGTDGPRKVDSRSARTSMSASRGRLSDATSGARTNNQSRSRGPNGEFRGSVGGMRNGPAVLQ